MEICFATSTAHEHAEFDESDTYVLERFDTPARNLVNKILLKLNLSDHRMTLEEFDKVEKYVGGLPDNIQGNVMLARPKLLQEAIGVGKQ
ncbi:hypothetical protein Tco_0617489 [Tanacetum coccineum]